MLARSRCAVGTTPMAVQEWGASNRARVTSWRNARGSCVVSMTLGSNKEGSEEGCGYFAA
jgi:hypothetical protein